MLTPSLVCRVLIDANIHTKALVAYAKTLLTKSLTLLIIVKSLALISLLTTDWRNVPNLIFVSVIVPCYNCLLVFRMTAIDSNNMTSTRFQNPSIWRFNVILLKCRFHEFPQFVFLLVWLTASDSCSSVPVCEFDSQSITDTENSPFSIASVFESEMLIRLIVVKIGN